MNTTELDTKARHLAKTYLLTEVALLSVLMEMKKQNSFLKLNYTGLFDYCERALNLSKSQSYYFKCVAEKAIEVPEIKKAMEKGEINLSKARRIAPVITPQNQMEWINKAKNYSQTELERAVTEVNPKAFTKDRVKINTPTSAELKVTLDNETLENLKALQDLLSQKTKKAATLSETIRWATKTCREKHDPLLKKAKPISLRK